MRAILLSALLALPAAAQVRVDIPAALPRVESAPAALASAAVPSLAASAPAAAPTLAPALFAPAATAVAAVAAAPAARAVAAAPVAAHVAALGVEVERTLGRVGDLGAASAGDAGEAGRALERALTAAPAAAAASAPELEFAAGAPGRLAERADDLAAERGLKARAMKGAEFLGVIEEARARADADEAPPTPAAGAAAREVRAAVARVARALIAAEKPLTESLGRALSVWSVMGTEMAQAAEKGTLAAICDDARLFASQVEASVEPAPEPAAAPGTDLRPSAHPEDAEGYAEISQPGSVFGWQPIENSPGHGVAPLDALIRFALAERTAPERAAGFEIPGAARRQDARVYFYGERHTDGGLIAANMRRLVEDARPGKPVLVLVEGYTGWTMHGYDALKYLAARGLDPEALAAKGVRGDQVEVRGWDTIDGYGASKRPLFQHHMNLLELNGLASSDLRGWRYYRAFARAAWTAWLSRRELERVAIVARNGDLDAAVARAAADADASKATVHVIAGADHLLEHPRLSALPMRPAFRKALRAALSGRAFWASMPASSSSVR
ncbi:MAG: hypothetical protein HKL90_02955 [Elusimicrobia bacterium]|nr:hypothetical protein [Elusimicrobiota bacterium]